MGRLGNIAKRIKALNIPTTLKRASALTAACILIPLEDINEKFELTDKAAAQWNKASKAITETQGYKDLAQFCSNAVEKISVATAYSKEKTDQINKQASKAAETAMEFISKQSDWLEAFSHMTQDSLNKGKERVQDRADKLQGIDKTIIRDSQQKREVRERSKEIWRGVQPVIAENKGPLITTVTTDFHEEKTASLKKGKPILSEADIKWLYGAESKKLGTFSRFKNSVKAIFKVEPDYITSDSKVSTEKLPNVPGSLAEAQAYQTAERHLRENKAMIGLIDKELKKLKEQAGNPEKIAQKESERKELNSKHELLKNLGRGKKEEGQVPLSKEQLEAAPKQEWQEINNMAMIELVKSSSEAGVPLNITSELEEQMIEESGNSADKTSPKTNSKTSELEAAVKVLEQVGESLKKVAADMDKVQLVEADSGIRPPTDTPRANFVGNEERGIA